MLKAMASPSTWLPATRICNSSGLHVHSTAARRRAAGPRAIRSSSTPVPMNAATPAASSTNTVSRTDVPPSSDAIPNMPVASPPYTDGVPAQSCTARATGSPSRASATGATR